jgi:hypothetical protein
MKLRAPGKKPIVLSPVRANAGVRAAYARKLVDLVTAMHKDLCQRVLKVYRELGQVAQDASEGLLGRVTTPQGASDGLRAPQGPSLAFDGDVPGHEFHGNQWSEGSGGTVDPTDTKSWEKVSVDPSKTYDIYHVTTDVSNVPDIAKNGFKTGAEASSVNEVTPDDRMTYFHMDKTAAQIYYSQQKEDGQPVLMHFRVPGKLLAKMDPRWDPIDDNGSAFAMKAPKGFEKNILSITAPRGSSVPRSSWSARVQYDSTPLAFDYATARQLYDVMEQAAKEWRKNFTSQAKALSKAFSSGAMKATDNSFKEGLRKAGFSVKMQVTPAVRTVLDDVVGENVKLISSIAEQHLAEVTELVKESVSAGRDLKGLSDALQERFGVTKRRAEFIARDQNNKATSNIHRQRQLQYGLLAKWRHTMASVNPRQEHEDWDGEIYDPEEGMYSEEEGEDQWPGTAINCGCSSESVIPGADDEDEEEEA